MSVLLGLLYPVPIFDDYYTTTELQLSTMLSIIATSLAFAAKPVDVMVCTEVRPPRALCSVSAFSLHLSLPALDATHGYQLSTMHPIYWLRADRSAYHPTALLSGPLTRVRGLRHV
jgi:DNA-directed RNA polymerase